MRTDDEAFLRATYALRRLVGDKWTPAILVALAEGPKRPSQILAILNSFPITEDDWPDRKFVLHDSILARALRKLLQEHLIDRHQDDDVFPPRVHYSLTPAAREYLELERVIAGWMARHAEWVAAVRGCDVGEAESEIDDSAATA